MVVFDAVAVSLMENARLQETILVNNAIVSSASTALQLQLMALSQNGAPPSLLATGTYGWSDLNLADEPSGLPFMTNAECAQFTAFVPSQAALKSALSSQMTQALPVPAHGIVFSSAAITCQPLTAVGTMADERAVFRVSGMSLIAYFGLFARDGAYVTYAGSVDHSVQEYEIAGPPLGLNNIRWALEDALRRIYLPALQSNLSLSLSCCDSFLTYVALQRTRLRSCCTS